MKTSPIQVLYFEDNSSDFRLIREYLSEGDPEQFNLIRAGRLEAGLKLLDQEQPDVILLDLGLPDSQGLETFSAVHPHAAQAPIIVLTGLDDSVVGIAALQAGAQDYLVKGEIDGSLLLRAIRYSIERKRAEQRIEKLNRTLHTLSDINQAIVRTGEPEQLFREACHIAVEVGGFRMAWIGIVDEATRKVVPAAWAGEVGDYLDNPEISVRDEPQGRGPTGIALREQHHEICMDIEHDPRMQPWRAQALQLGFRSSAAFPLRVSGRVCGAFSLYAGVTDYFNEEEVRLLEEMAGDISFAMEFDERERQRKLAEEKLRGSEAKFRAVVENSNDGILFVDSNGVVHYRSPSYTRINGYSDEEHLGRSGFETAHRDDLDELQAWWANLNARSGMVFRTECRIQHKDGSWRWIEATGKNLLNNPDVQAIVINSHDITERKQAEEAQRASENEFHSLAEAMPQIVWITRPDGWNIYFNQQWVDYTGLTLEESYGHGWNKPFHPDDQQRAWDAWQNATQNGASYALECRLRRADGVYTWWLIRGVPLVDGQGCVLKWFGTCTDINEIKTAQNEILQLNASLEQRVEERTSELRQVQEKMVRQEKLAVLGQLAGSVGHELRNPLGVISNSVFYLNLVLPETNDKVRQHLTMIQNETRNAAKIIGDLLDYARATSTEPQPLSIAEIVNGTLQRFPVPASVKVILELPSDLPQVYADALHMEQVLGNLVMNAWQAMPDGGELTISAEATIFSSGQPAACIRVKDSGMGISPENIKKIFDPLFSTKSRGIGLGLSVSQRLAEANGGRIEVESLLGQGSTFRLYLPVNHQG